MIHKDEMRLEEKESRGKKVFPEQQISEASFLREIEEKELNED